MGALLIKRKYPERKPCNVVKINNEASRILTQITNETGIPKYKLASQMILYASENIRIIDPDEEEEEING